MTKTLGLTGGIGSGKSTVCDLLESFGARIFRADAVGKQLMNESHDVRQEVTEQFGVDSYTVGGELNTAYLAEEVFADPERVRAINSIVHPRVLGLFKEAKSMAKKDGINLLILESALLFESGADELVEMVVVVDAPASTRIKRVMERDGVSRKDIKARMKHQMSPSELRKKADYVLHNAGSMGQLRDSVAELYRHIVLQT